MYIYIGFLDQISILTPKIASGNVWFWDSLLKIMHHGLLKVTFSFLSKKKGLNFFITRNLVNIASSACYTNAEIEPDQAFVSQRCIGILLKSSNLTATSLACEL